MIRGACGSALVVFFASHVAHAQSSGTSGTSGAPAPVTVQFTTDQPGVSVYSRSVPPARVRGEISASEAPEFARLCRAPCDAELPPALHEFALASDGGDPLPARPAFDISGNVRLRADIVSKASVRRTGLWIFGAMGVVGLTSTTIGIFQTCETDQDCQEWTALAIWGGIAVTTAGALIGLPMMAKRDEATLTLLPGTATLSRFPAAPSAIDRSSLVSSGATLVGRF
ncbi:MAG TPA: hypothetical protein VF103_00275 [Polyangiaceae bacterium]